MIPSRKFIYWLPAITYMAIIFTLSSFPLQSPVIDKIGDKTIHILEYGILVHLLAFALHKTTQWPLRKIGLTAITLTVLYGISDEIHQAFVPNRLCDWKDIIADFIGSLTILFTGLFFKKTKT